MNQEYLKSLVSYDQETGIFTRIITRGPTAEAGAQAGGISTDKKGKKYRYIHIDDKSYSEHRLAFVYMTGEFPKNQVDHIDGDGTNNKWSNLRDVTSLENLRNQKLYSTNTSGFNGVCWDKSRNKWIISISVEGRRITLGYAIKFEDAVKERKEANIKYGFHENHGNR